jgi:hypothetical protein
MDDHPDATEGAGKLQAGSPAQRPPGRAGTVGVHRKKLAAETLRLYASDWTRFAAFAASVSARPT